MTKDWWSIPQPGNLEKVKQLLDEEFEIECCKNCGKEILMMCRKTTGYCTEKCEEADVLEEMAKAKVILFKNSGKYYTEEEWEIPTEEEILIRGGNKGDSIIPYCMIYSKDFHRVDDGKILVITQEPWGYPHLL